MSIATTMDNVYRYTDRGMQKSRQNGKNTPIVKTQEGCDQKQTTQELQPMPEAQETTKQRVQALFTQLKRFIRR